MDIFGTQGPGQRPIVFRPSGAGAPVLRNRGNEKKLPTLPGSYVQLNGFPRRDGIEERLRDLIGVNFSWGLWN